MKLEISVLEAINIFKEIQQLWRFIAGENACCILDSITFLCKE